MREPAVHADHAGAGDPELLVGGVVGNQMGGGSGKTAMTVLGAIGGGLAGNEIEKRTKASTAFDVQVRMEDGTVRTVRSVDSGVV